MNTSKRLILPLAAILVLLAPSSPADAFCGFFVAKADSKLFNKASQVALVRNGERTTITMGNDYQGEAKDFAMVIPVPVTIKKDQVKVIPQELLDKLDKYSAPRLAEYQTCEDFSACHTCGGGPPVVADSASEGRDSGVTIEEKYAVGEYDILVLRAKQSDGLLTWLRKNDYNLPSGAEDIVGSYIKQNVRFFLAKVNLEELQAKETMKLSPLQVTFKSPKFMLPIRLGTLNAKGDQELFVYGLSRKGRIETSNYRNIELPTDLDVPVGVKEDFGDFYKTLFDRQFEKSDKKSVFLEYAWDMGKMLPQQVAQCDPCAAPLPDLPKRKHLEQLGVDWLASGRQEKGDDQSVYFTRLHLRYNAQTFPDDLRFVETGNRANYQDRYVIRHAPKSKPASNGRFYRTNTWNNELEFCSAGETFKKYLIEAPKNYTTLTGKTMAMPALPYEMSPEKVNLETPREPMAGSTNSNEQPSSFLSCRSTPASATTIVLLGLSLLAFGKRQRRD